MGTISLTPGWPTPMRSAPVVVADRRVDRAEAVVAGRAAAGLDADLAGRQVDLVMDDDDVAGLDLVEAQRLADRPAGLVHEGLRLEEQDLLAAERALGDLGLEASPPRAESRGGDEWRRPP